MLEPEQLQCVASVAAHRLDPMLGPIEPRGSQLADAVEALGVAAAAAVRRGLWPGPPDPAAVVLVLSRGLLVAGSGVR